MSDLLLDLDELNVRHERSKSNRTQLFEDILKSCHNKIKKYNKEFKKQECLFIPPPFIIGKPPYNYGDLVCYLIESLTKNGIKTEWLPDKQALYVSWKPDDVDHNQYQSHFTNTVYQNDSDQIKLMIHQRPSVQQPPSKSKPKKDAKPLIRHVAMLDYGRQGGIKDLIPINTKGLRG